MRFRRISKPHSPDSDPDEWEKEEKREPLRLPAGRVEEFEKLLHTYSSRILQHGEDLERLRYLQQELFRLEEVILQKRRKLWRMMESSGEDPRKLLQLEERLRFSPQHGRT